MIYYDTEIRSFVHSKNGNCVITSDQITTNNGTVIRSDPTKWTDMNHFLPRKLKRSY